MQRSEREAIMTNAIEINGSEETMNYSMPTN